METSAAFEPSIGDLVWVRTGLGSHEEPAVVVKTGCELPEEDHQEEDELEKNAAILVRFTVSFYEGVYHPTRLRPFEEKNTKGRRRSARSVSPLPNNATSRNSTGSKRKVNGRNQVTPSPRTLSSETSSSSEEERKRPSKRKTGPAKSQQKAAIPRKKIKNKSVTNEAASPYFATSKKPSRTDAAASSSEHAARPERGVARANSSESLRFDDSSPPDDDSDDDRPFRVEYSKTGRATCRTCDEIIAKGEVRIGHTPLFRGKPGFQVYRHLHCAVFSEEIDRPEDVGGWSKLEPDDHFKLAVRVEESKEEVKRESEELEPDELVPVTFQGEIRPSPPGLTANLLPFQVEGASWMYHQEIMEKDLRSGILADEMGMGKTVQTIAAILDNRTRLQHSKPGAKHPPSSDRDLLLREEKVWNESLSSWKHEMDMNNVQKSLLPKARGKEPCGGARAGTLVVCPVIALSQWKSEIEKFSEQGALTVCIYHGPNRSTQTPRKLLTKYDVVLTTYQVLEADFRKMVSPNKVKCPNCGGKFKVDKLRVHLKYFCGEGAQRTEAQARQVRNRDRVRGRRPGNPFGGKKGGNQKKKEFSTTTRTKKSKASVKRKSKVSPATKRAVRIRRTAGYDSESDLSVEVAPSTDGERPSRSAAVTASKRMASSKKDWGFGVSDSDEYESESSSSRTGSSGSNESSEELVTSSTAGTSDSESESSSTDEDEAPKRATEKQRQALQRAKSSRGKKGKGGRLMIKKKGSGKQRKKSFTSSSSDESSESESSSSDEDEILKRAREKQRQALQRAKSARGKKDKGGKTMIKKKMSGKKRKKSFTSSNSSTSGSSDESSVEERNGLEGIDMDRLVQEAMEGSVMSPLHSLCWWRIVLDEAHFIKNRSSQTAAAAFALIGIHRWCLSGTPLQNRVGEFYSLIRFLRINPMAHYFCKAKGCDCKSLHYRMLNGKCQGCGHGSVQHFSHFNKHVLNPIQRDGYSGDGRRAMFKLKNEILDKCLLRRTKENRAADMNLPPRLVTIRTVRLHPVEEDFYNALYTQTRSSFDDYVADGTLLNNYAHIFDLLMRMRQAVDHPYLVVYSKKGSARQESGSDTPVANGSTDCTICHEPPSERVVSSCCRDAFCRSCVLEYMSSSLNLPGGESTPCPSCRAPFSIDLNQVSSVVVDDSTLSVTNRNEGAGKAAMPSLKELPHVATGSILRRINLGEYATSSKIEALTQELVQMRQTSPGSKAIVFSQFVNMLDLIRWRLHSDPCLTSMGLGGVALHGGMDVKARDASLKSFREDNDVRVLLISLKAGGVALNLTVANHIYLMDPWWNPAAEMQAIDRTHRLGQYRPIRAVRFIAEDTVEERILQLQEKKRLVFDGTVGRDAGSLKMLTVADMKSLFA